MLLQALRTPVLTVPSWHTPLLFALICFKHQSPGLNLCCVYHPMHKMVCPSVCPLLLLTEVQALHSVMSSVWHTECCTEPDAPAVSHCAKHLVVPVPCCQQEQLHSIRGCSHGLARALHLLGAEGDGRQRLEQGWHVLRTAICVHG